MAPEALFGGLRGNAGNCSERAPCCWNRREPAGAAEDPPLQTLWRRPTQEIQASLGSSAFPGISGQGARGGRNSVLGR
eukprot:2339409-Alexandrium_andersonii.AAC.1